jgi:toxin YoeB
MRYIRFAPDAWREYMEWHSENEALFDRINELIKDMMRDAFKGIGKPEPLKNNYKGCWSRRITLEHRLIYRIDNETITILSCFGHYEK